MILITEESRLGPELVRDVLLGKTVSHTLQSSTQTKDWPRTSVETQPQMRMPKQFGASLKVVLLFTIGSIVTLLVAKTKALLAKAPSLSIQVAQLVVKVSHLTPRFNWPNASRHPHMETTLTHVQMHSIQAEVNSLIPTKVLECGGELSLDKCIG
jgi:hypothetical protein